MPEQQSVVVDEINDEIAVEAATNRMNTLLAYFKLNENDHAARLYTCTEIPAHYVDKQYKENGNKVFRRSNRKSHFNFTRVIGALRAPLLLLYSF